MKERSNDKPPCREGGDRESELFRIFILSVITCALALAVFIKPAYDRLNGGGGGEFTAHASAGRKDPLDEVATVLEECPETGPAGEGEDKERSSREGGDDSP